MSDRLRDALDRRASRLRPTGDALDLVLDRARARQRNRRVGTAALALALFVGAAAGAWVAFRSAPPPAPSDVRVLPASLGGPVSQVVTGAGSVWASVSTGATEDDLSGDIVRLDPGTGEVIARIHLEEAGAIAVGEGAAWVTNLRGRSVTRIDLETNEVSAVIPLPDLAYEVSDGDAAFIPNDVAVNAGRVWVSTARGSVFALVGNGEVVLRYDGDPAVFVDRLVSSAQGVWALFGTIPAEAGLLDPVDGQVWETVELRGPTVDVATGGDGTWALSGSGAMCEGATEPGCLGGIVLPAARELLPGLNGRPENRREVRLDERPLAIAVGDDAVFIALESGRIIRATPGAGSPITIGSAPAVTDLAVLGDELWVATGDRLVALPTTPATPSPDPSQTGEPTPEPTGTPSTVPDGACAFPAYIPTYLPWLGSTDALRLARPDMSRTYEGGGPQGLDPGYSTLTWSAAEGQFGVTLWRATQSAGDGGSDPDVPALPDGSTGRFYLSEQGEDIAIIWSDALPETHADECGETTLVIGWSGATDEELRAEAAKVAGSLERYDWEETWPPSSDDGAFAVWPVDTPVEAAAEQVGYVDPEILALTFGEEVLHWRGCRIVAEHPVKTLEGQAPVTRIIYEVERDAQGPTVEVEVAELLPGQWFVTAVYGTQVSVTVRRDDARGWTLEVSYDGPDATGGLVDVRVGYGTIGKEAANRALMDGSGAGSVTVDLGGLETNMPGNVVILFHDASGQPYVAQAFALPPGETSLSSG